MLEIFDYVSTSKGQTLYKTESIFLIEGDGELMPFWTCTSNGPPEIYKCEYCSFEAYLKVNLKVHEEMVHRLGLALSDSFCTFADNTYNLNNILKCYVCKKCNFMTFSLLVLLKHESQVCKFSENPIKLCEPPIKWKKTESTRRTYTNPTNSTQRIYTNSTKLFECGECKARSSCKYQMARHIELKHRPFEGVEWFECEQCYFKTRHKGSFKAHKLQHMSAEDIKWFKCGFCSYQAKQKGHLVVHVNAKHTPPENIQWFECVQCAYKAKCNSALNAHIRAKHTAPENLKWLQCELCSYKCKRKTQLKQHMKMKGVHKGY